MSISAELDYKLRAEARRQAHLESVRETVESFLGRYERTLSDMRTEGTAAYVPEEFEHAESLLQRAQGLLGPDPESAMSVSRQLGSLMYGFAGRARRLRDDSMTADAAARWRGQAAEIRAERAERQAREAAVEALRERRDAVRTSPAAKSKSLLDLAEKLERIAAAVEAGEAAPDMAKVELESAEETMVAAVTDEKLRRETLRAAVETLKRNGFVFPSGPKLQDDGFVRLDARRPGGQASTFLVSIDGAMRYDFAGYRGMSCKKDIDAVFGRLREVYGVKFSDERVIRRIPDEIGREAKPIDGNRKGSN